MDTFVNSIILIIGLFFILSTGVWIFLSLMVVSFIGLFFILGLPLEQVGTIMANRFYSASGSWELACVPMFILMGEIIFRTDISDRLFSGLAPLVNKLPGRLLHINVFACAIFAAVSGSSAATTATVGKITLSELNKRNYDKKLSIGSLAGAGSFGFMIPPSIVFIIYGVLAEESIAQLFLAGVFPGLMLAGLYSLYIIIWSVINPKIAPKTLETYNLSDYIKCFIKLLPIAIIVIVVFGTIYSGVATPTEAAAVGITISLVIAIILRQMNLKIFIESILESLKTSCMICTLVAAAGFLSTAMGLLHIPQDVSKEITSMNLSPHQLIFMLSIFYVVLGFFLEGISILVMTLPICLPLVVNAGFNPIWFGVFFVIMVELALITPPVGFNLFVIQGMSGYPIEKVAIAAAPFFFLMVLGLIIVTIFPEIVLWLPGIVGF